MTQKWAFLFGIAVGLLTAFIAAVMLLIAV
jgi:hypothetical protein